MSEAKSFSSASSASIRAGDTKDPTPGPWSTGGIFDPKTNPRTNVWGPIPKGKQSGELICKDVALKNAPLITAAHELLAVAQLFVDTIHAVENRCMAADGPVTPTHAEITDDELRKVYEAANAAIAKTEGRTA